MASLTQTSAIQAIHRSRLTHFTLKTFSDLLDTPPTRRLFQLLSQLETQKVIQKLAKNKYILVDNPPNQFALANFLFSPSYISFETALNFHSILSQIPKIVTSATTKKRTFKPIDNQLFTYDHLNPRLFWGYDLIGDYLIAQPEKALLDQAYFHLKHLKSFGIDEYDLTRVNKNLLTSYLTLYPKTVANLLLPYI